MGEGGCVGEGVDLPVERLLQWSAGATWVQQPPACAQLCQEQATVAMPNAADLQHHLGEVPTAPAVGYSTHNTMRCHHVLCASRGLQAVSCCLYVSLSCTMVPPVPSTKPALICLLLRHHHLALHCVLLLPPLLPSRGAHSGKHIMTGTVHRVAIYDSMFRLMNIISQTDIIK